MNKCQFITFEAFSKSFKASTNVSCNTGLAVLVIPTYSNNTYNVQTIQRPAIINYLFPVLLRPWNPCGRVVIIIIIYNIIIVLYNKLNKL